MTAEVASAIEELRLAFPSCSVTFEPEVQGGAYVTVSGVDIGEGYTPSTTWLGFLIGFQYPRSDVYPHYTDVEVKRTDKANHGGGFANATWCQKAVIQISRRSNRLDPTVDTAATKLAKVIEWVRAR